MYVGTLYIVNFTMHKSHLKKQNVKYKNAYNQSKVCI